MRVLLCLSFSLISTWGKKIILFVEFISKCSNCLPQISTSKWICKRNRTSKKEYHGRVDGLVRPFIELFIRVEEHTALGGPTNKGPSVPGIHLHDCQASSLCWKSSKREAIDQLLCCLLSFSRRFTANLNKAKLEDTRVREYDWDPWHLIHVILKGIL